MARKPEKEVVLSAYNKDVSPGFVYDFSTKKYSPGDTMLTINIEECIPEHQIKVKSKKDLSLLKKKLNQNAPWTQDFDVTKFPDYILLEGDKICEHKGNVEPRMKLGVVSSIYYKSFIDMLICFNDQIEERAIEDLEKYIKSVKLMKSSGGNFQNRDQYTDFNRCQPDATIAFIPPSISNTFSKGYIYVKGKRTSVSSIKYGLEEFCNYLVSSETSKFPVCCKVKYPLCTTQDSYASVVKNEYPINAQDEMPAVHPSIDQSCCIGGRLSDSVPHMKQSQRIELPVAHNTRSKAKVIGTNGTPFSQLNDVAMKELEKSKSIPDRTHACRPRTEKTLSGKAVDKRGEQQLIGCHVSDRKPLHHKNSEVLNTSQLPQDDASTNYSNKDVCCQSSQNLTKPECVELKMYVSEKCTRGDELRSNNSTVHNSAIEKQFQEKLNFPHSSHVAGDMNNSEKHESLIEKSQSKFELKTVIPQIMSDKSYLSEVNKSRFSTESSTLIMPVKELEVCGVMRKFYGATPKAEGKTIILLGASGSGKTTLVNFIANYFHGNKRAAGKLVQVVKNSNDFQGHTRQITGYTFCVSEDDSPLTIIDTPGLNDSSGAEVYDHVQSLKTFLANADSQNLKIHAIGFVAQAHIVRLTSSERLIMDYISSLFGKEIGKHVISFVTFSDNQETPPIVEAINNYGMNCSVFLKFNNSALSSNNEEEIDELDRIYWRIGCKSLKKCIKLLEKLPRLSFKSLMDEIYVTQFLEVAEKNLRTEIMDFVDHYRRNKGFAKEVLDNGERVWTLAEAVKELRCINASQCSTIDNILLSHVEGICNVKNSCLSSKECIKLLSLSPSRPLLKAGLAIISSIAPLYNSVKQICIQSQNLMQKKETPDVLFCYFCEKDHVLKREQKRWWGLTYKSISYKCSECDCAGDLHGEKGNEHENHKIAESYGFTPDKMLHHTRNSIEKVLQDLCLPEYKINENKYMNWLRLFAKQEAQQFCIDLLNIS